MVVAVSAALGALVGGGLAAGVVLLVAAIRGVAPRPERVGRARAASPARQRQLRPAVALAAAVTVGVATRWPVGALLAGLLGWFWPALFGAKAATRQAIARIEAIAAWAEMLRGMMASAASIEQAITATVPLAPTPIRDDLAELAERLRRHQPLPAVLRPLADAIDDDVGDLVVGALLLAADPGQRAGQVAEQLAELAVVAREKATMRLRVQADRARLHAAARAITLITLGVVALLVLFGRGFLAPYGTLTGQLTLLGVGALFAAGLAGLARLGRAGAAQRFIRTAGSAHGEQR